MANSHRSFRGLQPPYHEEDGKIWAGQAGVASLRGQKATKREIYAV